MSPTDGVDETGVDSVVIQEVSSFSDSYAFSASDLTKVSLENFWTEIAEQDPSLLADPSGTLELSGAAQVELVMAYQRTLRLRRALDSGTVPAKHEADVLSMCRLGETYTSHLLRSMVRIIHSEVWNRAKGRLGAAWAREVMPEMVSAANLAVLSAAATYDPSRRTLFTSWAVSSIKQEMTITLGQYGGSSSFNQAESRVGRIAHGVRRDLEEAYGRSLTGAELTDAVENSCYVWALDKLTPEQRELPLDQQQRLMKDKLTKQGMFAALKNLTAILQAMQGELDLDAPLYGDQGFYLRDVVSDGSDAAKEALYGDGSEDYQQMLGAGLGNLTSKEAEMVLQCLNVGGKKRLTYKSVAQDYGVADLVVRRMVKVAEARLQAPHAQFAYMSGSVQDQFEPDMGEDETQGSAVGALRRKKTPKTDDSEILAAMEAAMQEV